MVHVTYESFTSSQELAAAAAKAGAAAIAVAPPVLAPPGSAGAALDWMALVGSAAPGLPIYYYHRPEKFGSATEIGCAPLLVEHQVGA